MRTVSAPPTRSFPRTAVGPLLLLAALLCAAGRAAADVDAPPGWERIAYARKPEGNLTITAPWRPDRDLRLLVARSQSEQRVLLRFGAEALEGRESRAGQEADSPLAILPAESSDDLRRPIPSARITLKFRRNRWLLYVEDRLLGLIACPFLPPAAVFWPADSAAPVRDSVRFQPVADIDFRSDFMIEEGAPNELYPWQVWSGAWRIHTALDEAMQRPESRVERIKQVPLTPDKSPNFYCLKAEGKGGVITTGYDFYDEYECAVAVQVNDGDAGPVFHHRDERNFYAFTVRVSPPPDEGGRLTLWRLRDGRKTVLAAIRTDLFVEQWYRPKVRVETDRIRCWLDNVEVACVRERLPVGGRIGLYASTDSEIRFDDVKLSSRRELRLEDVGHVRFHTLRQEGSFHRNGSFWRRPTPADQRELRPARSGEDQTLVLGRPHNRDCVFSADFAVEGKQFGIGLVAGYQNQNEPYCRFTVERTATTETCRLVRVLGDLERVVDEWSAEPPPTPAAEGAVKLMVDASTPGVRRFYRGDALVLVEHAGRPLVGGAGPWVAAGTSTVIRNPDFRFQRQGVHKERPQPNEVYQQDSYMRHWAAPEGQWLPDEDGRMWHKGDFFGDFSIRLPCVPGAELHVGVEDGRTEGALVIAVRAGSLTLRPGAAADGAPPIARCPLPRASGKTAEVPCWEFCREGVWVWVSVGGKVPIKHRLAQRLPGTRVLVSGMTFEHLAASLVTRHNVIDDFFEEAPHQWVVNGGNWKVINRFQCTPSWSHMDGESPDGMAALWSKRRFKGDLTLEFYVGMRHGWYSRAGDLNCTIMASDTAPDAGYTVTCTEWDYNHSQNWSTLYRRGRVIERSDKYLVPRLRAGNERRYYNPLIVKGRRPVHGAWYYVKIRRVGRKVEYFFDNELVFSFEDPAPLAEGLVGIWTFMNSMTVARAKICFEQTGPRPFEFRRLPAAEAAEAPAAPGSDAAQARPVVTNHGVPLDSLSPDLWTLSDPVGHARMESFRTSDSTGLRLINGLGSGAMFLAAGLPPAPLDALAGWRFQVKRTHRARLNFHYTLGRTAKRDGYRPGQSFFHHLNGADFSDGEYLLTGRTDVPACERLDGADRDWGAVQVWIPSQHRLPSGRKSPYRARVEGFGHRQPNATMGGIGGAFPGDGYAVRQFTPVFYEPPQLAVAPDAPQPAEFLLSRTPRGPVLCRSPDIGEIVERLQQDTQLGLNVAWLRVRDAAGRESRHELAWVRLPEAPEYEFGWAPDLPDTVRLAPKHPFPDPRFRTIQVSLGRNRLDLTVADNEVRWAVLPRASDVTREAGPELTFTVRIGRDRKTFTLPWRERRANGPPVLLGVDGATPLCETFEDLDRGKRPVREGLVGRLSRGHHDPQQGAYLVIRNERYGQRLAATLATEFSLAEHPLMLFRYQAFDMARLTAAFDRDCYVRLNDDFAKAVQVRLSHDLKLDETWRSWLGFVTDACNAEPFSVERFTPRFLRFGSCGSPDQSGRYSKWRLDDLVFGPAVARPEQLAMTPRYFDADGVAEVRAAVSQGPVCYADMPEDARRAVAWVRFEPGRKITPDLSGLPDGVHHVLLKAVDTTGLEARVTDAPFLLDRKPLRASYAFEETTTGAPGGAELRIAFANHGGAPWAIGKATFHVCGKRRALPAWGSRFVHNAQADTLFLNYPFICRKQLDGAADGEALELAIDDIVDGAGNRSPRLVVPIETDHARDEAGPAWYHLRFSRNVYWFFNWDGRWNETLAFSPGRRVQAKVVRTAGSSARLQATTFRRRGELSRKVRWQPDRHPWISFRMLLPDCGSRTRAALEFTASDGAAYTLSLNKPGRGKRELNHDTRIAWTPGRWNRLSFNVRRRLADRGLSKARIEGLIVRSVTLKWQGGYKEERLFLDDFFIHAAAPDVKGRDTVEWTACDASGVKSLEITCLSERDKALWQEDRSDPEVALAPFRQRAAGKCWLSCRAKDNAGNRSVPFWLPFPGE